jgi:hypothetical protein
MFKSVSHRLDLPKMTQQLAPRHPTLQDLLEDSQGKIIVVLGTGEEDAWKIYADSLQKVSRKVQCVEITCSEHQEDVSIGLLQDFVEKRATEKYRIFLIFSNNPTLPFMIKHISPYCYMHQVRFNPDSLTGMFRPEETPIAQTDSYEKFMVGDYEPENVRAFCLSASLRRLGEATDTLLQAIGDRSKLVLAYQDVRDLISTADFSIQPWQDSKKHLPKMLDAWNKLEEAQKTAWRAFGEEREVILQYLELAERCQDGLLKMHEAIGLAKEAKNDYYSPKSIRDEALVTWMYRHKTAEAVVKKAHSVATDASERLEQEESPLGIHTVSTSVADSWTQCLSDVTFDVTQLVKKLIQQVKTLASDIQELLAEDSILLKSL